MSSVKVVVTSAITDSRNIRSRPRSRSATIGLTPYPTRTSRCSATVRWRYPIVRPSNVKTREGIALATAAVNGCEYCTAAHTYTGYNFAHLSADGIDAAKRGEATDPKLAAALHFARLVAETRGNVGNEDISQLRAAGYDDAQILEIAANVAKNFLTNLINSVTQTDVDFPAITADAAA